jgi:hypothetical protein
MTSPSSTALNLRAQALAYARRGWPVFPLLPQGKEPRVKTGFKVATTEENAILAWWNQWPDSNIGLATGIAFDVLDIDGPEGRDALLAYFRETSGEPYIHPGPVSRTGKGVHMLFAPTGFHNGAGMLDHVDFRGIGGYIVAPPSLHPLGHRYTWDERTGRDADAPLPPATPWLEAILRKEHKDRTAPKGNEILPGNGKAPAEIMAERVLSTSGLIAERRRDIIEVAFEKGLDPVNRGAYHVVRCPFHDDSTPSMALYPAPQDKFYCYGCGAHGDSYDLADQRDMTGLTF